MGVELELQEALKEAMRAKDKAVLDVVRTHIAGLGRA